MTFLNDVNHLTRINFYFWDIYRKSLHHFIRFAKLNQDQFNPFWLSKSMAKVDFLFGLNDSAKSKSSNKKTHHLDYSIFTGFLLVDRHFSLNCLDSHKHLCHFDSDKICSNLLCAKEKLPFIRWIDFIICLWFNLNKYLGGIISWKQLQIELFNEQTQRKISSNSCIR